MTHAVLTWFVLIFCPIAVASAVHAGVGHARDGRAGRAAVSAVLALVNLFAISVQGYVVYVRHVGECANAPAVVEYHDGMTLCPGQSTVVRFHFDTPAGRDL